MQTPTNEPVAPATCRCGHGVGHFMVSAEGDYTAFGWVALIFGISVRPIAVRYRCRRCNTVFHETTDPKVLADHR